MCDHLGIAPPPPPAEDAGLSPAERWRNGVEAWLVPQSILDQAPEPATLEPERFRWRPDEDATKPVRPSRRRALEALSDGGSVLDVGVGGGGEDIVLPATAAEVTPERVAFTRRRLCTGSEHDAEIAQLLEEQPPEEMRIAALWWPGTA